MKTIHVLGHNSNWNIDAYLKNNIGDGFLISAFSHSWDSYQKPRFQKIKENSFIDLQFYGKQASGDIKKGKLSEYPFHPANFPSQSTTSEYLITCVKEAIEFQLKIGLKKIIIPHVYEDENVNYINSYINQINSLAKKYKDKAEIYMTLPFANHVIIEKDKVESILFNATDKDIVFDGYYIVCENKPEFRKKITTDTKIIFNLSRVFKTLKNQKFKTIYGYANWDSLLFLAQTDIDYITIGTYENLRNFNIKRFTENISGGASKGFYFSEKLLNVIKADDLTNIRHVNSLNLIRNEKNIFSDIILQENYEWNIHKPDVNKNYLLSLSNLLQYLASIQDLKTRKKTFINMIDQGIKIYTELENRNIYLQNESENYHLATWKTYFSALKE